MHDSHKKKPQKDGGTLPGDLMTQEILQTKAQKKPIEGQSKIKQDRVGPAMLLLTAISQIQTLGKAYDKIQTRHTPPILILI
jgi:hypothetical protein